MVVTITNDVSTTDSSTVDQNCDDLSTSEQTKPKVCHSPHNLNNLPTISNCVYLYGAKDMRLGSQCVPSTLAPNEVLIKVYYSGICGSDMHYYHQGTNFRQFDTPVVLGHEPVGTILAVGSQVKNFSIFDRVAIEPNINCHQCKYCRSGQYSICSNCLEIPPRHGFNQEFVVHLADLCHLLPDNVPFKDAALAEPLSCCLHAVTRSKIDPNSIVLITGAGPMGLLTGFCAKAFGAAYVIISDINQGRLDHAISIGAADAAFVVNCKESLEESCKRLNKLLPSNTCINKCIDCTCVESSVALAVECTAPGGTVALVGMSSRYCKLDVHAVISKELHIVGSSKMSNEFALGVDLLARGKIPAGKVVSHIIHYKDFQKALDMIELGMTSKVLLEF